MQPELYFDISSVESGGSLYRVISKEGHESFIYHHSTYDVYTDDIKVFQTAYSSFTAFWKELTKDPQWFYMHALYVHPEQRSFVAEQLKNVDWQIQGDRKWQESHQRQWKKVLTDPKDYYNPLK
ncbi:MAG: hypothetical protein M3342_00350 [Bacteroidota bacterium]|nr:hypothetical protein [Flavisolibacter sp.]MBD0284549.1 hypothetical protein [Flavisolibacter sp.]MBD0374407.1 hypothetical protein [Flavisolibacter sp.]MDQ3842453.1 hypothetical protein [Bacteroidota bacterium]